MEHNQNTMPRLVINAPCESNFVTIPDFFISRRKNWLMLRGYFGSWGHVSVAVAVVERFKKELSIHWPPRQKNWHFVEVRL